jgi:hypothetical protein
MRDGKISLIRGQEHDKKEVMGVEELAISNMYELDHNQH